METFYDLASKEMDRLIATYLDLLARTNGLSDLQPNHLETVESRAIVLAGVGSPLDPVGAAPERLVYEWQRMAAIPFDVEAGITVGVYRSIRQYAGILLDEVEQDTGGFRHFTSEYVSAHPHFLPIFQHLAGLFSKAALKRRVGNASDRSVSHSVAERLADLLNERTRAGPTNKGEILQRLESTLEGIVRDLVGKVLLENIVANALTQRRLPFKREREYRALKGVVYDYRADFVLPSPSAPLAFIDVRKSSTRHASLYAKDKMFSAINWKGKYPDLLGVLVVDGPWTAATLKVMARVFDYVVPITSVAELAEVLEGYLAGDRSKLRWLIQFRIMPAS